MYELANDNSVTERRIGPLGRFPSSVLPPKAARGRKEVCEDTSLLSDHLGEARTKFVGGLNITSREGFGRPPSALRLGATLAVAM